MLTSCGSIPRSSKHCPGLQWHPVRRWMPAAAAATWHHIAIWSMHQKLEEAALACWGGMFAEDLQQLLAAAVTQGGELRVGPGLQG